jgi:hypothetical protein
MSSVLCTYVFLTDHHRKQETASKKQVHNWSAAKSKIWRKSGAERQNMESNLAGCIW